MRSSTRQGLGALGLYTGLTLLAFLPILPYLGSSLAGPAEDNMFLYWNLWWGTEALHRGLDLLHTRHLLWPEGHSLLLHTMSWGNLAIGIPLGRLVGLPLAYNLLLLASFVAGAMGAYLLAGRWVRQPAARLLAGLIFAFNPFHMAQALHHLNIASIHVLPLFVWFHLRLRDRVGWADGLGAAGCLALAALCSWYFLVFGLLYLVVDVAWSALSARQVRRGAALAALVAGGGALLALLPLLVPMARLVMAGGAVMTAEAATHAELFSADLLAFLAPNPMSPFWGNPEAVTAAPFLGNPWEAAVSLGWVPVAALVWTLGWRRKGSGWLLAMALTFLVLALGPRLHLWGHAVGPAILPYRLVGELPLLNIARVPSRMVIMAHLFLGILAARALEDVVFGGGWLAGRLANAGRQARLAGIVVALVAAQGFCLTAQHTPVELPAVYAHIDTPGDAPLLDLPTDEGIGARFYMMYQTLHHRPIAGGALSRLTHHGIPLEIKGLPPAGAGDVLRARGVRHLVVHKGRYAAGVNPEPELSRWFRKRYEDETHVLYDVEISGARGPNDPGAP
ncbi:MAG: hypothetical protein ABIK09_01190 [Pseudomonadota bacterium]